MKLKDLHDALQESKTEEETPAKAPPVSGELCSSAQAAKILGVSMGRIRQYKQDGTLKAESNPEPGSRDNWFKLSAVQALKDKQVKGELPITGRPKGS